MYNVLEILVLFVPWWAGGPTPSLRDWSTLAILALTFPRLLPRLGRGPGDHPCSWFTNLWSRVVPRCQGRRVGGLCHQQWCCSSVQVSSSGPGAHPMWVLVRCGIEKLPLSVPVLPCHLAASGHVRSLFLTSSMRLQLSCPRFPVRVCTLTGQGIT